MGISMLSIMLFHQYFTSAIPFNYFHNFGYWGVDIFMYLSGMGLVTSLERNSNVVYYKRRFKRLFPSCILCGTTKYFTFLIMGTSVSVLQEGLKIGVWSIASLDLWFIHSIIILYVISPLLYHSLCNWGKTTLFFILTIFFINGFTLRPLVGYDWLSIPGVISWTIERLPVFTAGMFVGINKKLSDKTINISYLFLFIAISLRLLRKTEMSFLGIEACEYISLTFGIPALIVFCIIVIKVLPSYVKCFLNFMGSYSLELYLTHEFIFWVLKICLEDKYSPWILLPSAFFLSFVAAFICKLTINKLLIQHE